MHKCHATQSMGVSDGRHTYIQIRQNAASRCAPLSRANFPDFTLTHQVPLLRESCTVFSSTPIPPRRFAHNLWPA